MDGGLLIVNHVYIDSTLTFANIEDFNENFGIVDDESIEIPENFEEIFIYIYHSISLDSSQSSNLPTRFQETFGLPLKSTILNRKCWFAI